MSGIYNYDEKNVWTFVRVENDTLVTGYRQTNGWARTRTVYFAMSFSQPITQYGHAKYDKTPIKAFGENLMKVKTFLKWLVKKFVPTLILKLRKINHY